MGKQKEPLAFLSSSEDPPSLRAILGSALELFSEVGISGTSVRAIGDRAGYSNPAIFKYFKTKEDLALHLFEKCYMRYYTSISRAVESGDFHEKLKRIIGCSMDLLEESPEAFLFVQDNLREFWPRLPREKRRYSIVGILTDFIETGKRDGIVRPDVSTGIIAAGFLSSLLQFARLFYFGEFPGPAVRYKEELEMLLQGMLEK